VNKGLIFDIRRYTIHDGPGIRTTVFFKGCPLRCWWCHNPESQAFNSEESIRRIVVSGKKFERTEITGKLMSVDEVMHEVLQDQLFYDESGGGVTFSGGEPLLQDIFLLELIKACKQKGIHTALDTSGYAHMRIIEKVANNVDLFLYDLKMINNALHRKYTGVFNISILDNLKFLCRTGKNVIIRFPVIPGINDMTENINDMKGFIANLQVPTSSNLQISLLPYHNIAKGKYQRFRKTENIRDLSPVTIEQLEPIKNELETTGISVRYGS